MSQNDVNAACTSPFNPGSLVWRIIVPAWIATGATFKLISASPRTLPESLLDLADDLGIGLFQWLALLIGLEFLAIGIMLFVRPLARLMAIFMLASFCVILALEMAVYGNVESCGCLGGSVKVPPWVMLSIDGALLLATLLLGRKPLGIMPAGSKPACACWGKSSLIGALAVTIVGFGISFGRLMPLTKVTVQQPEPQQVEGPDGTPADAGTQPPPATAGQQLPAVLRTRDSEVANWVGMAWSDVELSRYLPTTSTDLTSGRVHIIFYRRSCSHCEEMFQYYLTGDLPVPVVAVEVPETRLEMYDPNNKWDLPETNVEHQQLPLGPDWIIVTPLIVTMEDGIIRCAEQGDHEACYYFFE